MDKVARSHGDMLKPSIHANGTDQDSLCEMYTTALDKVREAMDALVEAAPNARDYYPQGEHAYTAAVIDHGNRLAKLLAVRDELAELLEHCAV